MKEWTQERLEEAWYTIKNAKITKADLSMADYGCLTLDMTLEEYAWGCIYGGYVIGHGFLGASEFKGTESGTEYIMRVMDTVGVENSTSWSVSMSELLSVTTKGFTSSETSSRTSGLIQRVSLRTRGVRHD